MTHEYHDALPGYHPDQILHDGCEECEFCGGNVIIALSNLDAGTFRRAWLRAADWRASTPPSGSSAEGISSAEAPLLEVLWSVQLHFESIWPLGTLPEGTR